MTLRTSTTNPLRIDEVLCAPEAPGVLGVTFCPGKCGDSVFGAPWSRDLEADVQVVKDWGAQVALTLVEQHELESLQVPGLGAAFTRSGLQWVHLAIRNLHAPDQSFHTLWDTQAAAALRILQDGWKVLVHCRGGLGRAGTVSCILLIELGVDASDALARVRGERAGAVETAVQEDYVKTYAGELVEGQPDELV